MVFLPALACVCLCAPPLRYEYSGGRPCASRGAASRPSAGEARAERWLSEALALLSAAEVAFFLRGSILDGRKGWRAQTPRVGSRAGPTSTSLTFFNKTEANWLTIMLSALSAGDLVGCHHSPACTAAPGKIRSESRSHSRSIRVVEGAVGVLCPGLKGALLKRRLAKYRPRRLHARGRARAAQGAGLVGWPGYF